MGKEPEIYSDELPEGRIRGILKKLKEIGSKKIAVGPMEATAGAIAVAGTMYSMGGTGIEAAGKAELARIQPIIATAKMENAPKTLAALEEEEIKAASEIIEGRTMTDWGMGIAIGGGAITGTAASLLRKKRKPGEVADEPPNQDIKR